ncbi:hypothetical protein GCM10029978_066310 [Actinoallomurus acanthiterrae]
MSEPQTVGERIKLIRAERRMSAAELVKGTRWTAKYVLRVEGGKHSPSAQALRLFATRLSLDVRYLAVGLSTSKRTGLLVGARCADMSLGRGEPRQALQQFAALLGDPALLLLPAKWHEVAFGYARALEETGHLHTALVSLESLRGRLEPDDKLGAYVRAARSRCHRMEGHLHHAAAVADAALSALADRPVNENTNEAHVIIGIEQLAAYAAMGEHRRSRRLTVELLARLTPDLDPSLRSAAFEAAAQAATIRGDVEAARNWTGRAEELVDAARPLPQVRRLSLYGSLQQAGDDDTIAHVMAAHDAILTRRGLPPGTVTTTLIHRVRAHLHSDDLDEALATSAHLMDAVSGTAPAAVQGQALAAVGEVLAADGELKRAASVLTDAASLLQAAGLSDEAREITQRRSSLLTDPVDVVRTAMSATFTAIEWGVQPRESAIYALPQLAGLNTPLSIRQQESR